MITNEEGIKEPVFPHEHNGQEPAFPEPYLNEPHLALSTKRGLTKREYFAGLAMQGLVAKEGWSERIMEEGGDKSLCIYIAAASVKMADELLKQLEQGEIKTELI